MNAQDEMNLKLFNASGHLLEAAKNLKGTADDISIKLLLMADTIASIIEAPEQKINKEDMNDILNDILNAKE